MTPDSQKFTAISETFCASSSVDEDESARPTHLCQQPSGATQLPTLECILKHDQASH